MNFIPKERNKRIIEAIGLAQLKAKNRRVDLLDALLDLASCFN